MAETTNRLQIVQQDVALEANVPPGSSASSAPSVEQSTQEVLRAKVKGSVEAYRSSVKAKLVHYRVLNTLLISASVLGGIVATTSAGAAGIGGDPVMKAVPGGWQTACYVAAVSALLVTIASTISAHFQIPETLTRCRTCKAELDNLMIDFEDRKLTSIIASIKKLKKSYSDFLAEVAG